MAESMSDREFYSNWGRMMTPKILANAKYSTDKARIARLANRSCDGKHEGYAWLIIEALDCIGALHGSPESGAIEAVQKATEKVVEAFRERDEAKSKVSLAQQLRDEALALVEKIKATSSSVYEVRINDIMAGIIRSVKGVFHKKFPRIVELAKARMNVFLYGPTGLGKTFICEQLSKVLGLQFSFIQCTGGMSEGQLLGRLLPVGEHGTFEYVASEFVNRYEEGGIFLLDEIDAADPNVLLVVNAALANGHLAIPNRPANPVAKRHPDFICIAAANTVGTGADRTYSGRNKLDAATLDRFQIGKVHLNYDNAVDEALCPDEKLRNRLLGYRTKVLEHRLERAVSTRFMRDAYRMVAEYNWTYAMVDEALFEGWRAEEKAKVGV